METKMQIKKIAILTFLILTFFIGCGDKDGVSENMISETKAPAEKALPVFNLKTIDGKDFTIKVTKEGWKFVGLEDKVVLLNFFGTWCPPCKAEIPHLLNIRSKLEKDFEILSVDIGKRDGSLNTKEELEAFIKEFNVTYPIVTANDNGKLFGAVSELNPSGSIPFMILFNKKGEYVQYYIGMKPEEMLFSDISKAISMQ
jgi:thiol-disulfide isomerase/thioredoxin